MFSSSLVDVPRPFIDPIRSLIEALGVANLVLQRPRTSSTVVLALDTQQRGLHLNRFNPLSPRVFHDIVADTSHVDGVHSIIVFSSRMTTPIEIGDLELFDIGNTVFAGAGLLWHDWVVIGVGGLYCPRTLLNQPDPWARSDRCT